MSALRETLTALGPTELFSGPMASAITRLTKEIRVLGAATFTTLNFQFPAGTPTLPVNPTDPSTVTFPAGTQIGYVKSFQLLTGSIQVIYNS